MDPFVDPYSLGDSEPLLRPDLPSQISAELSLYTPILLEETVGSDTIQRETCQLPSRKEAKGPRFLHVTEDAMRGHF